MAKGKGKTVQGDWEWVGIAARTVDEITPLHRRRAAGLARVKACPPRYTEEKDGNVTEDSVKLVGDNTCGKARCKKRIQCYNHLGIEEVSYLTQSGPDDRSRARMRKTSLSKRPLASCLRRGVDPLDFETWERLAM